MNEENECATCLKSMEKPYHSSGTIKWCGPNCYDNFYGDKNIRNRYWKRFENRLRIETNERESKIVIGDFLVPMAILIFLFIFIVQIIDWM